MPEPGTAPPVTRELNLSAEIKKGWGDRWNEPEVEYEFQGGKRVFKRRTGDAAIYATSPDFG